MHRPTVWYRLTTGGFNPRPALRPGDAGPAGGIESLRSSFNPRPALRPGDAWACAQRESLGEIVSIRARP